MVDSTYPNKCSYCEETFGQTNCMIPYEFILDNISIHDCELNAVRLNQLHFEYENYLQLNAHESNITKVALNLWNRLRHKFETTGLRDYHITEKIGNYFRELDELFEARYQDYRQPTPLSTDATQSTITPIDSHESTQIDDEPIEPTFKKGINLTSLAHLIKDLIIAIHCEFKLLGTEFNDFKCQEFLTLLSNERDLCCQKNSTYIIKICTKLDKPILLAKEIVGTHSNRELRIWKDESHLTQPLIFCILSHPYFRHPIKHENFLSLRQSLDAYVNDILSCLEETVPCFQKVVEIIDKHLSKLTDHAQNNWKTKHLVIHTTLNEEIDNTIIDVTDTTNDSVITIYTVRKLNDFTVISDNDFDLTTAIRLLVKRVLIELSITLPAVGTANLSIEYLTKIGLEIYELTRNNNLTDIENIVNEFYQIQMKVLPSTDEYVKTCLYKFLTTITKQFNYYERFK
jgi:hypothetical protein